MKRKQGIKRILSVLSVFLLLLLFTVTVFAEGGNGDGTGGGKDKPLALESCSIPNGAENVSQNPEIVLTFNKNVVHFTVRDNNKTCFSLTDENGNIVPILVLMGDDQVDPTIKRIITVKPQNALSPGTMYLLKIGGEITSKSGVSIGRDTYVSFTVGGEKPTQTPSTEPSTTEPSTTQPTTTEPSTVQPSTMQPTNSQPTTAQPTTTQPTTTQPTTTEPSTAQPTTTQPEATTQTDEMSTVAAPVSGTTEPTTELPVDAPPYESAAPYAGETDKKTGPGFTFYFVLFVIAIAATATVTVTVILIIKKKKI